MFLNTGNLNEGGCRERCSEAIKKELREGKNPKTTASNWNNSRNNTLVNSNWQKLRK